MGRPLHPVCHSSLPILASCFFVGLFLVFFCMVSSPLGVVIDADTIAVLTTIRQAFLSLSLVVHHLSRSFIFTSQTVRCGGSEEVPQGRCSRRRPAVGDRAVPWQLPCRGPDQHPHHPALVRLPAFLPFVPFPFACPIPTPTIQYTANTIQCNANRFPSFNRPFFHDMYVVSGTQHQSDISAQPLKDYYSFEKYAMS